MSKAKPFNPLTMTDEELIEHCDKQVQALRMALDMIECEKHDRRHVRWAIVDALKEWKPALAEQPAQQCNHCNGSGRMVRDPDIGTDQECFVCDGAGAIKTEQPAQQEPVAWGVDWGKAGDISCVSIIKRLPDGRIEVVAVEYAPYSYTSPPEQRKPLTDEQIVAKALHLSGLGTSPDVIQFARAIEAAHNIKENT